MDQKIKFTADSTCDLTKDLVKRFNLSEVIPLQVILGEKSLYDGAFDTREIYRFVEESKLFPKTSAANIFDFKKAFEKHTADGSAVIHFSISNKLSASFSNAVEAAKEFKNIYIVDGKSLSTGTSLLIFYAYDLLKKNPSMEVSELAKILNGKADSVQASFCVDTLSYLHKGGRCSALALVSSNLLKIHPSLHLNGGEMKVGKKYIGKMPKVIPKYIADLKASNPDYDNTRCFITYTVDTDHEIIEAEKNSVKELFDFKEILETTAGSTVTSHCGLGTIGLLFMNK